MTRKGETKFRIGSTKSGSGPDRFGWIHFIGACKRGQICVIDNNYHRLSTWSPKGKFTGSADLSKLFGLGRAHTAAFSVAKDGAAWFAVSADRELKRKLERVYVAEALIYRVTGL